MIVLKEGTASLMVGGEVTGSLKTHEDFGDDALLSEASRTASLVADTDGSCFVISRSEFQRAGETAVEEAAAKETAAQAEVARLEETKAPGIRCAVAAAGAGGARVPAVACGRGKVPS